jgi:hypothetical protein
MDIAGPAVKGTWTNAKACNSPAVSVHEKGTVGSGAGVCVLGSCSALQTGTRPWQYDDWVLGSLDGAGGWTQARVGNRKG